jgi:DNA topoisomerase VI subunit B
MKTAPRLERLTFRTSRLLDFVGKRELTAQIGHGVEEWPLSTAKELVDNAIDAAEEAGIAPKITIDVVTKPGAAMIRVADNGPGIDPTTVAAIIDYAVRVSSREAYVSPTRGAQGNALKTILAMGFALSGERGETIIESRGTAHRLGFGVDQIRQEPRIEHKPEPSAVKNGTSITLRWPDSACSILSEARSRFLSLAESFGWFNAHLALSVVWDGLPAGGCSGSNPAWSKSKWSPSEPTSAHWYDAEAARRYVSARLNLALDSQESVMVRDLVAEFRGLSGTQKRAKVLAEIDAAKVSLADFATKGDALDDAAIGRLFAAMKRHSRAPKAKLLGVIGEAHLRTFATAAGVDARTFRYKSVVVDSEATPIVIEAAFGYCPDLDRARHMVTGVNFSAALGSPFRSLDHWSGEGLERLLAEQRAGATEPIVFVLHMATPRARFTDRGKTSLVLAPGVAKSITEAVKYVTRAWARQRKAEERDRAAEFNRRARLFRTREMSVKEAAFQVMEQAYLKASDGGKLPVKARQIMYKARPMILDLTGKPSLNDEYFTQTLLPDYLKEHEECGSWRIDWDARGHLKEPHTDREVALGSAEVREYLNGAAIASTAAQNTSRDREAKAKAPAKLDLYMSFPTCGPEHRYRAVLFVEKEGFGALFKEAQLAERFDLAIMSTKGMSNTSSRKLLDDLSQRGVQQIFVLHDFDVSGFSIFGTLGTSNRRYNFDNQIPVVDIGLRLVDVDESLETERVATSGDWDRRVTTLRRHGATEEEIDFLRFRRVELNAMTSRQLLDLIETKLHEDGVEKLIPEIGILERHARRCIEQSLTTGVMSDLLPRIAKQAANYALPADLYERVAARLEASPSLSWDFAVSAALDDLIRGLVR